MSEVWFEPAGVLRVSDVLKTVCKYFNVRRSDLCSERRTANLVMPRHIGMHLSRVYTTKSYPFIARKFGRRDHTTALYADKKISNLIKEDWKVAHDVAHLSMVLENHLEEIDNG